MKLNLICIGFALLACGYYSCGSGSKDNDPAPVTKNGNPSTTVIDTTFTVNPTETFNTSGANELYDVGSGKILSTLTTNGDGGGVQTTDGGNVSVALMNIKDSDFVITNTGDLLTATFIKTADPIFEYTIRDNDKRTITKVDVHINRVTGSTGSFTLQSPLLNGFKNSSTVWNAVNLMTTSKSSTQLIQNIAIKN